MKFTSTSQKIYDLEANVTDMNMAKNRQNFKKKNTIKKLVIDDKEITEQTHILEHIREFYETVFKTRVQKTKIETENFFSDVHIPKLSENQVKLYEKNLTKKD